jgi:hypothetical protein
VECGVSYANDYGDMNDNFYISLTKMYVQSLTLMKKENCLDKFHKRALKVVDDSSGIGWGFHDYVVQVYFDFYPEDFEDEEKTTAESKL